MNTMRFWYTLTRYAQSKTIFESQITLKYLGARKPKDINRTSKISYDHLCLREEYLNFNNKLHELETLNCNLLFEKNTSYVGSLSPVII